MRRLCSFLHLCFINLLFGVNFAMNEDSKSTRSNIRQQIRMVFSDLDGTLIHYPDTIENTRRDELIQLPASSTGMVGVISKKTFALCQEIRQSALPLYFVSGMRFTTMLSRVPYLPRADAYCCDAGGRIFMATDDESTESSILIEPCVEGETPFYLTEDMDWRKRMEAHTGRDGYIGNGLLLESQQSSVVAIRERDGPLWQYAKQLLEQDVVLDARGYSTCFRVNRKQQRDQSLFDKMLRGEMPLPQGLATSTNLGCIDVYPAASGKKNWCVLIILYECVSATHTCAGLGRDSGDYLARRLAPDVERPLDHALFLCDDDNDIEMALACQHSFIPAATSLTMKETILSNVNQLTLVVSEDHDHGQDLTEATEKAIEMLLRHVQPEL